VTGSVNQSVSKSVVGKLESGWVDGWVGGQVGELQGDLTLILLTWRTWRAPNNASRCQMGFNWPFKGLSMRATIV